MAGKKAWIFDVTEAEFEEKVIRKSNEIPVLVDFWAAWCGPCRALTPLLERAIDKLSFAVLLAKVNTDENSEWAMKFGVQGIPTMLFVSGGKVIHRQVGALPERMLRDVVTQFMEVVAQA